MNEEPAERSWNAKKHEEIDGMNIVQQENSFYYFQKEKY
jgi:uncharacterized protein YneR